MGGGPFRLVELPSPVSVLSSQRQKTGSPALTLSPGESHTHIHRTLHLIGGSTALDHIAQEVLGVSLTEIANRIK